MLEQVVANAVSSYGVLGLFAAMVIQSIIVPIPSEFVLMLGGISFGTFIGGIVGAAGGITGGAIGFHISRKLGRSYVEKVLGKKSLDMADRWFSKHGAKAVLVGRLTPMIPDDVISYSAGLTNIDFKKFLAATIIGGVPRAFFYAYVGVLSSKGLSVMGLESSFANVLLAAAAVFVLVNLIQQKLQSRMV